MYKLDLHTHSIMSPDGSIQEKDFAAVLEKGMLDYIAITDHNSIDFAQKMQEGYGEKIIIGEEVQTTEGEVIGLFLHKKIDSGQTFAQTITAIHKQDGLVYIPHPFDTWRHGVGEMVLLEYLDDIDIIEGFNGRIIFPSQNKKAEHIAIKQKKTMGIGSDAHLVAGLGFAYAMIEKPFTRKTALENLGKAKFVKTYQPWWAYFGPKLNRLVKHL